MNRRSIKVGFSFVEILIALFIVSLTATNISVLQKMVSDQSRDNFSHTAVIALVSKKLEEVVAYDVALDASNLYTESGTDPILYSASGTSPIYEDRGDSLDLSWNITVSVDSSTALRDITITVTWPDALGIEQAFTSNINYYSALIR